MPKVSVKADTILTELKRQIAIGNFARGSALPSQYELAKLFQVSHMTVRKAIAGLSVFSSTTRFRKRRCSGRWG